MKRNFSPQIAEFIGTFFLVFLGCGSMILAQQGGIDGSFIPIIFGGTISVMIYSTGHISGAHFNPAVTLAFAILGKFPRCRVLGYLLAQFIGGLSASAVHLLLWGSEHSFGATALTISPLLGLLVEVLLTFLLMFVIVSVATDARAVGEMAGIAIGSTVALCSFFGGPLTGASMNPARTLGPAVLSGNYQHLWLYLLIPPLGAVLAAYVYTWIKCQGSSNFDSSGGGSCC